VGTQHIEIEMTDHMNGTVKVDGVEIHGVYALSFTAGIGQCNDLTLQIRSAHVTITGPAAINKVTEG